MNFLEIGNMFVNVDAVKYVAFESRAPIIESEKANCPNGWIYVIRYVLKTGVSYTDVMEETTDNTLWLERIEFLRRILKVTCNPLKEKL